MQMPSLPTPPRPRHPASATTHPCSTSTLPPVAPSSKPLPHPSPQRPPPPPRPHTNSSRPLPLPLPAAPPSNYKDGLSFTRLTLPGLVGGPDKSSRHQPCPAAMSRTYPSLDQIWPRDGQVWPAEAKFGRAFIKMKNFFCPYWR